MCVSQAYNARHPYHAVLCILAFVYWRNIHPVPPIIVIFTITVTVTITITVDYALVWFVDYALVWFGSAVPCIESVSAMICLARWSRRRHRLVRDERDGTREARELQHATCIESVFVRRRRLRRRRLHHNHNHNQHHNHHHRVRISSSCVHVFTHKRRCCASTRRRALSPPYTNI